MYLSCVSIKGKDIPSGYRYWKECDETDYSPLVVGKEYLVYGFACVHDRIDYLVYACETVLWVPGFLFNIKDRELPQNWALNLTMNDPSYSKLLEGFGVWLICGYKELVEDFSHYVGILERRKSDLQIFLREKEKVESWWCERGVS